MYGVAEAYSDVCPGRSGESLLLGDAANEEVRSVGDCSVGLWDGA
jgi:hypothetical protein